MASLKYNTSRIYVSPYYSGNFNPQDLRQLHRVQSSDFDIEIVRSQQVGLGDLNVNDSTILESPIVNLNVSYLVTDGNNENAIGLITDGGIGSLINLNNVEREYYIVTDSLGTTDKVFAIGNARLNSYSVSASINQPVVANFSIKGYNIKLDEGLSGNYQAEVIKKDGVTKNVFTYSIPEYSNGVIERETGKIPSNIIAGKSNITLTLPTGSPFAVALGTTDVHVQSFNLNINIPRQNRSKIGYKYPLNEDITYPIQVTADAELILSDYQKDQISDVICKNPEDIVFTINNRCAGELDLDWNNSNKTKLKYTLKGAKYNQEGWGLSIGSRATINVSWALNVGNVHSLRKNLFISGDFGDIQYQFDKINSFNYPTGIKDMGFQPFDKELDFQLVKVQNDAKTFDLIFQENLDLDSSFIYPSFIYKGTTAILSGYSGILNEDLTISNIDWEVSAWGGKYDLSSNQQTIDVISGFQFPFKSGYEYKEEPVVNKYFFDVRSYGWNTGKLELEISFNKTGYSGSFLYPILELDPFTPRFFNCLNLSCLDKNRPLNDPVSMTIFAKTPDYSRYYLLKGSSEDKYHWGLLNSQQLYFNTWIDAYDLHSYSGLSGVNDTYFEFDRISNKSIYLDDNHFMPISGVSGKYGGINNKATIEFTSDAVSFPFQNVDNSFTVNLNNFTLISLFQVDTYSGKKDLFSFEHASGDLRSGLIYGVSGGRPFFEDRLGPKLFSGTIDNGWHSHIVRYSGGNTVNLTIDGINYGDVIVNSLIFLNVTGDINAVTLFKYTKGRLAEFILSPYAFNYNQVVSYQQYFIKKWGYL